MTQNFGLDVSPQTLGEDAASAFYVDAVKPSYYEVAATVSAEKDDAGYKSNAYLIFDYQNESDFKSAGFNPSTNKSEIGHKTAAG